MNYLRVNNEPSDAKQHTANARRSENAKQHMNSGRGRDATKQHLANTRESRM